MKKLNVEQMENVEGGRCRWWQMLAGGLVFATAPFGTGLAGAGAGFAIWTSACR